MIKNKIIFLDIDGVIAIPDESTGSFKLGKGPTNNLGIILDKTDAKIVLSSSWRKDNLEDTKNYMEAEGFKYVDRIVGVTIRAHHYISKIHLSIPRGVEIKQWIDTNIHSDNGKDYSRKIIGQDYTYVIIDDDNDMLLEQKDHFIHVINGEEGLTFEQAFKAVHILNNYDNYKS